MKIEEAQKAARNAETITQIVELIGRLDRQDAEPYGSRQFGLYASGEGCGAWPSAAAAREMRSVLRRDLQKQREDLLYEQTILGVE